MKSYPSILSFKKAPHLPCLAFYKYDGSNIRAEWSKKRGWYKYGTRNVMIDARNPDFGEAITLFEKTMAEGLSKVFKDNKSLPSFDSAVVFMEYCGVSSFAGQHVKEEPKELILFDVNLNKRGFVLPREFVKAFGHLRSAEVVYEGNFGAEFISDVQEGKYKLGEGVVAKGSIAGKKEPHNLWMAKVKTKAWLEELRRRAAAGDPFLSSVLQDNLQEQSE